MKSLTFRFEPHPEAMILHLRGDAGLGGIDELARAAKSAAAGEPDALIIEASGLSYIGSMGVGVIIGLRNSVHARGGRVSIAGCTVEVDRLMRFLRIDHLMPMHATLAEALAATAQAAGERVGAL
ncbi:MAG: STAS domain-containing protein [Phycisphaerales bacterium]